MALNLQTLKLIFWKEHPLKNNIMALRRLVNLVEIANLVQLAIASYPLPNNHGFNSLPNCKLLDRAKLKSFADKLNDAGIELTFLLLAKNCECHDFQHAKCNLLLAI